MILQSSISLDPPNLVPVSDVPRNSECGSQNIQQNDLTLSTRDPCPSNVDVLNLSPATEKCLSEDCPIDWKAPRNSCMSYDGQGKQGNVQVVVDSGAFWGGKEPDVTVTTENGEGIVLHKESTTDLVQDKAVLEEDKDKGVSPNNSISKAEGSTILDNPRIDEVEENSTNLDLSNPVQAHELCGLGEKAEKGATKDKQTVIGEAESDVPLYGNPSSRHQRTTDCTVTYNQRSREKGIVRGQEAEGLFQASSECFGLGQEIRADVAEDLQLIHGNGGEGLPLDVKCSEQINGSTPRGIPGGYKTDKRNEKGSSHSSIVDQGNASHPCGSVGGGNTANQQQVENLEDNSTHHVNEQDIGENSPGIVQRKEKENCSHIEAFLPSSRFEGSRPGYVFKIEDQGLGYYVEGYQPTRKRSKQTVVYRPWNSGPGGDTVHRGPIGPLLKPPATGIQSKVRKTDSREESKPFMARMIAHRNSRGFQSTLLAREKILDQHMIVLLEGIIDPSKFRKRHGYNIHGEMLGMDGKMIEKVIPPKSPEEIAKLPWYRKVYEERLGKHLPVKRLGDSIEARREALAYSRTFTSELGSRSDQLHQSLSKALQGVTHLGFVTEDYNRPGGYTIDGRKILPRGQKQTNELHQTMDQKERACSHVFKVIQRFRCAHEDITEAIKGKDQALNKMMKKMDTTILQEIADEAVRDSGMGIYRQKNRKITGNSIGGEGNFGRESSISGLDRASRESPEEQRKRFTKMLKTHVKDRDKELMKGVQALGDEVAEEMMDTLAQGTEILPESWRQDRQNLRNMERRRRELIKEREQAANRKVCPWRPGGLHIAHEPWDPLHMKDNPTPVQNASEPGTVVLEARSTPGQEKQGAISRGETLEVGGSSKGRPQRPRTAPPLTNFMDHMSLRTRKVLASQRPGGTLFDAFMVYRTVPYPLQRSPGSDPPICTEERGNERFLFVAERDAVPSALPTGKWTGDGRTTKVRKHWPCRRGGKNQSLRKCCARQRCPTSAWAEFKRKPERPSSARSSRIPSSPRHTGRSRRDLEVARPHSVTTGNRQTVPGAPPRPATATGSRVVHSTTTIGGRAVGSRGGATALGDQLRCGSDVATHVTPTDTELVGGEQSKLNLYQHSRTEMTVLWARFCRPSDVVHTCAIWPSRSFPATPTQSRTQDRDKVISTTIDTVGPQQDDIDSDGLETCCGGIGRTREVNEGMKGTKYAGEEEVEGIVRMENRDGKGGEGEVKSTLEVLEAKLHASSQRWVKERHRVFSGYADRSRKEQSWDPESELIEATSPRWMHRQARKNSCTSQTKERGSRMVPRPQFCGTVDMDWQEIDVSVYLKTAEDIKAALVSDLYGVVVENNSKLLQKRFAEARDLLEVAGALLDWPAPLIDRFKDKHRVLSIGSYVSTVSRVGLLWTIATGVVEILDIIQKREGVLKDIWAVLPPTDQRVADNMVANDRDTLLDKRLELKEHTSAVAESVLVWMKLVPWCVNVLYGGINIFSKLQAEEECVPWPPDSNLPGNVKIHEEGTHTQDRQEIVIEPVGTSSDIAEASTCTFKPTSAHLDVDPTVVVALHGDIDQDSKGIRDTAEASPEGMTLPARLVIPCGLNPN